MADYTSEFTGAEIDELLNQVSTNESAISDLSTTVTGLESSKQDVISDLSTIRSGAEAGATAYQLPESGIPSTDMAEEVQASLAAADAAAPQSTTYTQTETDSLLDDKADKVSGATSGNFAGLDSDGNLTDSGYDASDFATAAQGALADAAAPQSTTYTMTETDALLDEKADTADLEDGSIVPAIAENLESWSERDNLSVEDTFSGLVQTTGGDASLDSSEDAVLKSIVPSEDFYAAAIINTGFNLLHGATQIGTGYYFPVPALQFGTYGTANKPNGLLFTDADGNDLGSTPVVLFKALADGVPSSVTDGSTISYTDSNGYRFHNPTEAGYIIVSNITLAETCAHIGWSRRYNEFISPTASSDAGSSIALASAITACHSYNLLLVVGNKADRLDYYSSSKIQWTRVNDRVLPSWTTTDNGDETYTHTATISAMLSGGVAECFDTSIILTVDGTSISYTDSSSSATSAYVKYNLATSVTGQVSVAPSGAIEDWGVTYLSDATGDAYVTMQYAQGYPDAIAAMVSGGVDSDMQALAEAVAKNNARLDALEAEKAGNQGDLECDTLNSHSIPAVDGCPMILYAAGSPSASLVPVNWDADALGEWTGVPCFIGQIYIDTSASSSGMYYAKGTAAVTNWVQ